MEIEDMKMRGRKGKLRKNVSTRSGGGKITPSIQFLGNKEAKELFIKEYLDEHSEMKTWNDNIEYSVNKNKRWNLRDKLKNVVEENLENLQDEDFDMYATILHDPNTQHQYSRRYNRDSPKYFLSTKDEIRPVFVGKSRSHMPEHDFDQSVAVKLVIEDEEENNGRIKTFKSCECGSCVQHKARKKSAKVNACDFFDIYEYEADVLADMADEYIEMGNDVGASPENHSFGDFLFEKAKPSRIVRDSKPGNMKKQFKGKMILKEIDQDEDNEEMNDIVEIVQYDPKKEEVIIFLEDIWSMVDGWEDISVDNCSRRTMYNEKLGLIITIKLSDIHEGSIECNLRINSLKTEPDSLLECFTECRNITDLCHLAMEMFSVNTSNTRRATNVHTDHEVFIKHLSKETEIFTNKVPIVKSSECLICFEANDLMKNTCGEMFCDSCWTVYLNNQVGSQEGLIQCPGFGCAAPVPVAILSCFLPSHQLVNLVKSVTDFLVRSDIHYIRCPQKHCQLIIWTENLAEDGFKCGCGFHGCRSCRKLYHSPSTCQEYHDFLSYKNKIAEFQQLESSVEVRPCPKCETLWEKMYGCNFMHCWKCQAGFCWGCGKEHTDYNGICGKMTVPLDVVEILPFPTEQFGRNRIEAFNLSIKLRDIQMMISKREVLAVTHKILSMDRDWYLDNLLKTENILETERGQLVHSQISNCFNLCLHGKVNLTNSVLKKQNANYNKRKQIKQLYLKLYSFYHMMTSLKKEKEWEAVLNRIQCQYEALIRVKCFVSKA